MASLLIRGGKLFDGECFSDSDILVTDGTVEQIAPDIDTPVKTVFDATGMTVLPGLVDGHMHIAGFSMDKWGAPAQAACWPFGITAAAECGTIKGTPESLDALGVHTAVYLAVGTKNNEAILDRAEKMLQLFGDRVVGIKVCYDNVGDETLTSVRPLEQICEFAHSRGLRVHVHTTNTPIPMAELLGTLGRGDIATHVYHGSALNVAKDDFACVFDAKRRGVIIDTGFAGGFHVNFRIFTDAVAAGAQPDTISTDQVKPFMYSLGGRYGLPQCMSMARIMGMAEEDVFRGVTSAPADALGRPWGRLKVGSSADIAVLSWENEPFHLTDRAGNTLKSDRGYRCKLTLSQGNVVYKD